ncbi:type 1 glutamine amidotransferase domain-containing protein [Acinetobacter thermotolerans]|uniref:type 1 glutamine amidotransferase domain-containing protein n=1 Tax=Acinetobacter thermotolerans TaxID=3151487 RepID=UPI00325A9A9C
MKILIVLTSHDQLGETGEKTGFWLEELAAPYYRFIDAGAEVILASPKGGQPPLDPKSGTQDAQTEATRRFEADEQAMRALAKTVPLSEVNIEDFDAVFYPGGHGPLWDLANDENSIRLIQQTLQSHKPVALVCHAPGVLKNVQDAKGKPVVAGKNVTGFSNSEETTVGLTNIVPFLVEDTLKENGGNYSKAKDWHVHVQQDGLLITGQNPASSAATADALLKLLK